MLTGPARSVESQGCQELVTKEGQNLFFNQGQILDLTFKLWEKRLPLNKHRLKKGQPLNKSQIKTTADLSENT